MKVTSIKQITPKPSRCITVDSADHLFSVGENSEVLTRNSVSQQNIIIGCLLRPEHWVILGIDLKRVELSRFRQFGMKVATDLETAIEFLRFAQAVMMKRYETMEGLGINNFKNLPKKTQALLVMVDEAGELLSPTGAKSDEAKAADELKGEAVMVIGSIARLGRASGVHLVIATQRPDAKIIPGEVRDNFAARIGCGTLAPSASSMILGSSIGQRIPSSPPGGIYIQMHGHGNMGQGFLAPDEWLEEYYERHGGVKSNAVGADIGEVPGAVVKDKETDPLDDWDDSMDDLTED